MHRLRRHTADPRCDGGLRLHAQEKTCGLEARGAPADGPWVARAGTGYVAPCDGQYTRALSLGCTVGGHVRVTIEPYLHYSSTVPAMPGLCTWGSQRPRVAVRGI